MKKLLLLATALAFSGGVWANSSCTGKQHATIPPKNLSLYNKKTDNLNDYSVVRNQLIKGGWMPVNSNTEYSDYPEENCISDRCIYIPIKINTKIP